MALHPARIESPPAFKWRLTSTNMRSSGSSSMPHRTVAQGIVAKGVRGANPLRKVGLGQFAVQLLEAGEAKDKGVKYGQEDDCNPVILPLYFNVEAFMRKWWTGLCGVLALTVVAAQEPVSKNQQSLNDRDRIAFGVGKAPFDRELKPLAWKAVKNAPMPTDSDLRLSLDGRWDLQQAPQHGVSEQLMLFGQEGWHDAIAASIPASIQSGLFDAGKIHDPMLLKNNLDILWVPEREWWLRRSFRVPAAWRAKQVTLHFDGVDYRGTFWLNGRRLGQHEGMFGGPDFDVTQLVYFGRDNILVVSLDPAPPNYEDTFKNNVAYGWHYVNLVTSGIWRSVRLEAHGGASLGSPFLRTSRVADGAATVDLALDLWKWGEKLGSYTLELSLTPKNFAGNAYVASIPVTLQPGWNALGYSGELQAPKLWWPVDMGDPALYRFRAVLRDGNTVADTYESNFGVRTLRLLPGPDGPKADLYNNQFVVNNRFIFMKGANWCYPDAMLRLDRTRQGRFLRIARDAHIQYIRVWGGGPVENDDLYDLCDELGILVQQEFSMLGYHRLANVPSLHATDMTGQMVLRLRNRPSLAIWCGANEISGVGRIVEVLGRRCLELDGTRDFWRTDPYGGKMHWYGVYWDDMPLLAYRKVADGRLLPPAPVAFTEFGLSSPASYETWERILPERELAEWPIREDSVFVHHTPTYVYRHVEKMVRYAQDFLEPQSLRDLVNGMQLSQGLGLKVLIESMRSRKPYTTQTTFYKLTEDYPGASWATIDYYGLPKLSHYLLKQAYAPVHVMSIYDDWNDTDGVLKFRIQSVNDSGAPVSGTVRAVIYDAALQRAWSREYPVTITPEAALRVADESFRIPSTNGAPLFLCLDLLSNAGKLIDRDWSFYNFTPRRGSLFERPKTALSARWTEAPKVGAVLAITNTGTLPALGVTVRLGQGGFSYYATDSLFWLMPDETRDVAIERLPAVDGQDRELDSVTVGAWNAVPQDVPTTRRSRARVR